MNQTLGIPMTLIFAFATNTFTFHVEEAAWAGDNGFMPLFDRADSVTREGSVTTLTYGAHSDPYGAVEAALQGGVRVGNRVVMPTL